MIWRYLPYTLRLRAPAVLTAVGNDPNRVRTLPFIPGSAIRGVAAWAIRDPDSDSGRIDTFRRLIVGDKVRFLNAYPRAADRRSLPMPASFRIDKAGPFAPGGPVNVLDLAAFQGDSSDGAGWPETPLDSVPAPFLTLGAQPLRVSPERSSRFHHQRDRARGRAWTDPVTEQAHGSVFAFEFIESGQEFDGLIQLCADSTEECDVLAEEIRGTIHEPVLLGRSRRGGYGGAASVQWHPLAEREVEMEGVLASGLPSGKEFRLLLTSAYIGRDPLTGQLDPSQLTRDVLEAFTGRVEILRRRWSFDVIGGFSRKWRIEVPQALACSAGSVLVLKSTAPIPFSDLLAVEHVGFGERRVEGFGRAVFLDASSQAPQVLRAPMRVRTARPSGDAPELVRFAQARIMEAAVERAIREEAARLARHARRLPTPAVLGRLRNATRAAPNTALATLRAWLHSRRLRPPAMDQLERCLIDGRSLADWLRWIADEEDETKLAALLRFDTLAQRFHAHSESSARAQLTERATAIRARLIDATLAALARARRKEASK